MYASAALPELLDAVAAYFAPYERYGNRLEIGPVPARELTTDLALLRSVLEDLIHHAFSRSPTFAALAVRETPSLLEFRIADLGTDETGTELVAFSDGAVATLGGTLWIETNEPAGAVVCFQVPVNN